jgi:general secretion pathway protein D
LVPARRTTPPDAGQDYKIGKLLGAHAVLLFWSAMNRRQNKWALSTALILLLCLSNGSFARSTPKAKTLYQNGQTAEAKDDPITAYEDYYQAWKMEPKNLRYKTAYERLRFLAAAAHVSRGEKLSAQGDQTGALTEYLRALEIDPSNELAHQDIQKTRDKLSSKPNQETSIPENKTEELTEVGSPVQLKPISNEPLTLHMTEDSKVIYQTVGKAAGINVLFDPEYTSKRITVDIANVSLLDALRIVGVSSGTFWHPVTSNTIFVAMNTRAKRQELEEEAVQTFYLANIAQQNDLNDIQTALRNLLVNAKLYGVPSQGAIVMRATPDELLLAQKLINDLDKSRPEVVVDVALLEVNRDKTRTLGIQLPGSFGLQLQPPNATSTSTSTTTTTTTTTTSGTTTGSTTNLTLNNLAHLNATNFAVTVGQATANALLSDSDTKILQNPSIRATDGQKADLKVGERLPVATGSYQTGAATAVVSSLVNTQFTYMDVGVEIEITPIVHYDRDVTLKIKLVTSEESGTSNIGGITEPIISQRTSEQVVRLKDGEVNILGGFLQKQDLTTIGGTPGLGELPILKWIFASNQHEVQDDEIIFLITPHVVRAADISPLNLQEIDTGTGANVELRRISAPANGHASETDGLPPGLQPHNTAPPAGAAPAAAGTPAAAAPPGSPAGSTTAPPAAGSVSLQLIPPPVAPKVGGSFQVAVKLTGGKDIFSVPMQLHYDHSKLALINVDTGDYLGHDGQAIALVHRDDGVGNVVISASRPPGVAGVNGSGTVCLLTFQANAAGDAALQIIRASAKNSAQQAVNIAGSQTAVRVQ